MSGEAAQSRAVPSVPSPTTPGSRPGPARSRTFVEETLEVMSRDPDRELLVYGSHRMSAGRFGTLVHRMAHVFAALGIGRGATVTLLSGNLPETIAARYAANLAGCKVNHLYSGISATMQAAIVRDVETRALIVDPRLVDRAAEITRTAPVEHVLVLGDPGRASGRDLLVLAEEQPEGPFAARCRPDDICLIRHTGGTTGRPKGIVSAFDQAGRISRVMTSARRDADGAPRQLVCTTLAHAAGMMADGVLGAGGTVVLQDGFDPGEVLAAVERERITCLFLLPPLLYQLLDHPDSRHRDLSSLNTVAYGGCQASPARIADAVRLLGPVLVQVYAQNETGGISVLSARDHDLRNPRRLRSAGRVLPGVDVAVRDRNGEDLPTGELGEICVRSPGVMRGYWKQPELTAEVMREGWVHTGDLGHLDEEGYLTVVDRLKDMIVVVGGHVYTTELEEVLNSHPAVLHSAVFGVRDADRMEQVHAAVVTTPGSALRADELQAMVRELRGPMYVPARIDFVEALPLTDVGKPDKKLLRRQAEEHAAPSARPQAR